MLSLGRNLEMIKKDLKKQIEEWEKNHKIKVLTPQKTPERNWVGVGPGSMKGFLRIGSYIPHKKFKPKRKRKRVKVSAVK
jgi:hypothetical protein